MDTLTSTTIKTVSNTKLAIATAFLLLAGGAALAAGFLTQSQLVQSNKSIVNIGTMRKVNQEFINLLNAYQKSNSRQKKNVLAKLQRVAQQRKNFMETLAEKDPEMFLKLVLPSNLRRTAPKEILDNIEKEFSEEGEVEVLIFDDFKNNKHLTRLFLKVADKGRFAVFSSVEYPFILSGSKVQVKGKSIADKIVVPSFQDKNFKILFEAKRNSMKERKVAVILYNFENWNKQPFSPEAVKKTVFTGRHSVKSYFEEASFGQLSLTGAINSDGDVFGWYTLPISSASVCNNWMGIPAAEAFKQAADDGFVTKNYDKIIFIFPKVCSKFDGAALPGIPYLVVNDNVVDAGVIAHELGHSFGINGHAFRYSCEENNTPVSISENCSKVVYGDRYDVMGYGETRHLGGYYKLGFGWFKQNNILTVNDNGEYELDIIEKPSTRIQVLEIPRKFDSSGQKVESYFVEYRQPFGFDGIKGSFPSPQGVVIRLVNYLSPEDTLLIQSDPISGSDMSQQAFGTGEIFEDKIAGINIEVLSETDESAKIYVSFGPLPCIYRNPKVLVSPDIRYVKNNAILFPNVHLEDYKISILNTNNPGCSPSLFKLSPSLPSLWSQTSFIPITIPSGDTYIGTFDILMNPNAKNGEYKIVEKIENIDMPVYSALATTTVVVDFDSDSIIKLAANSPVTPGSNVTIFGFTVESPSNPPVRSYFYADEKNICSSPPLNECDWKVPDIDNQIYVLTYKVVHANGLELISNKVIVTAKK